MPPSLQCSSIQECHLHVSQHFERAAPVAAQRCKPSASTGSAIILVSTVSDWPRFSDAAWSNSDQHSNRKPLAVYPNVCGAVQTAEDLKALLVATLGGASDCPTDVQTLVVRAVNCVRFAETTGLPGIPDDAASKGCFEKIVTHKVSSTSGLLKYLRKSRFSRFRAP
jgi:hypothetical protein